MIFSPSEKAFAFTGKRFDVSIKRKYVLLKTSAFYMKRNYVLYQTQRRFSTNVGNVFFRKYKSRCLKAGIYKQKSLLNRSFQSNKLYVRPWGVEPQSKEPESFIHPLNYGRKYQ